MSNDGFMSVDRTFPCCRSRGTVRLFSTTLAAGVALFATLAQADTANGTIFYQSKAGPIVINVKNVYFVKGPDAVSGKTIRHLVFSPTDMSANIKSCAKMSCTDGDLNEGMTVDLDVGPRLNYWSSATASAFSTRVPPSRKR